MKKIIFFIILFFLVISLLFLWKNRLLVKRITFAECKEIGGTSWIVDKFHPDICPACGSCSGYSNSLKNFTSCPQYESCMECVRKNDPYPDKCPGGMKRIAVILDAAIWAQCCK